MTRRSFLVSAVALVAGCGSARGRGSPARQITSGRAEVDSEEIVKDRFRPGAVWLDTDGRPIQAHGGGMLFHEGVYYWFGENKDAPPQAGGWMRRLDVIGVNCYSSTDLLHWKNEGVVLPAVKDDPSHDLHPSRVVERPKVIYNDRTRTFVMWMHIDKADYGYARAGVATSSSPTGPYEYRGSVQPAGHDSRDMTVYKDDDGQAYILHSSEWNKTMRITRLSDDYLEATDTSVREFVGRSREAPAVFKDRDRYFCITSGCSGWAPNAAEYAVSKSVMGPWAVRGNPCVGSAGDLATTFHSQSTFVLPVEGRPGAYIFMADRWKPENLGDSRYVWLPLEISGNSLQIRWCDEWDLSVFDERTFRAVRREVSWRGIHPAGSDWISGPRRSHCFPAAGLSGDTKWPIPVGASTLARRSWKSMGARFACPQVRWSALAGQGDSGAMWWSIASVARSQRIPTCGWRSRFASRRAIPSFAFSMSCLRNEAVSLLRERGRMG